MLFNWTKEDSFNLKRIADAMCKLANIEVIQVGQTPHELKIEVNDKSLEEIAEEEAVEMREVVANKLLENKGNTFYPEDNLSLDELERL